MRSKCIIFSGVGRPAGAAMLLLLPLLLISLGGHGCACGSGGGVEQDTSTTDDGGGSDEVAQQGALLVWIEHAANKVQPTTGPGTQAAIVLEGPQMSYQAAQVVVRGSGGVLTGVNLTVSALTDGAGNQITASNVTFFKQHFIDYTGVDEGEPGSARVPEESPTGDPWIPDPLIPFVDPYSGAPAGAPFQVEADRNQPVWVDLFIPGDAPAGTYTGAVTVSADGGLEVTVDVTVTVWGFALPDMSRVPNRFGAHWEGAIHYHRDIYDCSGNNCWINDSPSALAMVRRYQELAHAHRIDTGTYFVPDPDSSGECGLPSDWSAFDEALAPYMDGSYYPDGAPGTWFGVPFSPGVDWGLEASCSQAEYSAVAGAWAAHLKERGWFDRAIAYAYDEPPQEVYDAIAMHSSWMQDADPDWKGRVMVTTAPRAGNVATLNPAVGIYCVCLRCYDRWSDPWSDPAELPYGRAEWPDLWSQGIALWFYESCAQSDPYPTFAANTLLGAEPQVMMWGAWLEGAAGFLLWDVVAWTEGDPWGPNNDFSKTGDGVLIYPGNHDGIDAPSGSPDEVAIDGPIPSCRLKMVRAGLQDWALFSLADELGLSALAREQVASVYGQMGGCEYADCDPPLNGAFFWRADGALMDTARRNVALAVLDALP